MRLLINKPLGHISLHVPMREVLDLLDQEKIPVSASSFWGTNQFIVMVDDSNGDKAIGLLQGRGFDLILPRLRKA